MITKLEYNWWGHSQGEDYYTHEVGKKNVTDIVEHCAQGEGDKWSYLVTFEDGHVERIFNPNKIYYSSQDEVKI